MTVNIEQKNSFRFSIAIQFASVIVKLGVLKSVLQVYINIRDRSFFMR